MYGFSVDVDGNAVNAMKSIQNEIGSLESKSAHAANEMKSHFGHTFKEIRNMALGAFGIFAGFEFFKSSLESFDKLEESVAKVRSALTSTKGVSGLGLEGLEEKAKDLSKETLFSRAQIMDAQSMLLTFTQIRGRVFNEAIPAIHDFATRYKIETADAALQVGKALNDPEQGLHRLTRMGVVFSAQQEEQIKHFMKIGDVASAQRVMLAELNTEFGGLSKAMAKTDEGKIKMAAKRWGEVKLEIGKLISEILVKLIPAFNKFMDFVSPVLDDIKTGFLILTNILEGLFHIIESNWQWLKYVVDLFLIWQGIKLFDSMVGGIGRLIKSMIDMPKYINAIGQGFSNWSVGILAALASALMLYQIFKQIQSKGEYAKELAEPYQKELGEVQSKEMELWKKRTPEDSEEFKALFNREKELSKILNGLTGQNGFMGTFYAITKEQLKGVFDSLAGITNHKIEMPEFKGSGGSGLTDSAFNTSDLAGAKGGLGEAKIINMSFNKPVLEINVPGGDSKDIVSHAQDPLEVFFRSLNNMTHSLSGTM